MEQITVQIEGQPYSVVGADFWEMLGRVRAVPGRVFRETGKQKTWELPCALEEARLLLAPLQIVDEDDLLDAEIADIWRVQRRLQELTSTIEQRVQELDGKIAGFSPGSRSKVKARYAHDSSLLSYALLYAGQPVEQLTGPQVKTLYAALRQMEE